MSHRLGLERVALARVARLATITPAGAPHLVPVVFAVATDGVNDRVWTAIDHKPKSAARMQRLANIEAHPEVSLLVDHYDDDWDELWWARADGRADVVAVDAPEAAGALEALTAKYPQYQEHPPAGPLIRITVQRWRMWSARGYDTDPPDGSVT